MARLTRVQLRAIFAKLGKVKSEIIKARGPAVPMMPMRSGVVNTSMSRVFSPAIADHYIQRLPQKHRDLSTLPDATRVEVWNGWIKNDEDMRDWAGAYFINQREIHVTRSLSTAAHPRGYFDATRFIPRATKVDMPPSGPVPRNKVLRWLTVRTRNAKVAVAHTFYHEYAHSILHGYLGRFDKLYPPGWRRLVRTKEWREPLVPLREKLTPLERPAEAFAEAYSQYATTKKTREQLRRTSPRSYEYMKRFFETGELD